MCTWWPGWSPRSLVPVSGVSSSLAHCHQTSEERECDQWYECDHNYCGHCSTLVTLSPVSPNIGGERVWCECDHHCGHCSALITLSPNIGGGRVWSVIWLWWLSLWTLPFSDQWYECDDHHYGHCHQTSEERVWSVIWVWSPSLWTLLCSDNTVTRSVWCNIQWGDICSDKLSSGEANWNKVDIPA